MKIHHLRAGFLAIALGTVFTAGVLTPAPAMADEVGTDAAIGAAVGSLVSSLLFDNNSNQYYYNTGGQRHYVNYDRGDDRHWDGGPRNGGQWNNDRGGSHDNRDRGGDRYADDRGGHGGRGGDDHNR